MLVELTSPAYSHSRTLASSWKIMISEKMPKSEMVIKNTLEQRAVYALKIVLSSALLLFQTGCVTAYRKSIGEDSNRQFEKIFLTDFETAWQAVTESLKAHHVDVNNQEGGFIQTKWNDNTAERNFTDSFGSANAYLKAKIRYRVNVGKGFGGLSDKTAVKVSVEKEQVVQQDVLEGWRLRESDAIEERTLLYRIGRLIYMKIKMAKVQEERTRRQLEQKF